MFPLPAREQKHTLIAVRNQRPEAEGGPYEFVRDRFDRYITDGVTEEKAAMKVRSFLEAAYRCIR